MAAPGYCAITVGTPTPPSQCRGIAGSWSGIKSLSACAAACSSCPSCNFVSFSLPSDDCSWYADCSLPLLRWHGGGSYRTLPVRGKPFHNMTYVTPTWAAKASPSQMHYRRSWCGAEHLRRRSYLLPAPFPFTERTRMVMEHTPSSCDFYRDRSFCVRAGSSADEPHVLEAVASTLIGCKRESGRGGCRAVDLGANNGWITLRMLALGANVTAVEPQADLSQAITESADLNCHMPDRIRSIAAYIEAEPPPTGTMRAGLGYRFGGRPDNLALPPVPVTLMTPTRSQRPHLARIWSRGRSHCLSLSCAPAHRARH